MAEAVDPKPSDSAEKAYAAAAELAIAQADSVRPDTVKAEPATELQFPAKSMRVEAPAKVAAAKAALTKVAKPAVAAKKPVIAKKVPAPKSAVTVKKAVPKQAVSSAPKFKTTTTSKPAFKEPIMTAKTTKKTKDYTATIKSAAADVQAKAKLALAKGSEVLGEAKTFTKGNVEALKASGKILGTGLQDLGKTYVAEGKSAYATVTGDVKELKAVKTPAQFVRLQTSILRRNLDHAFDLGGKNSETMIKLAGEAFAPISARAGLAVAKVKKAA